MIVVIVDAAVLKLEVNKEKENSVIIWKSSMSEPRKLDGFVSNAK